MASWDDQMRRLYKNVGLLRLFHLWDKAFFAVARATFLFDSDIVSWLSLVFICECYLYFLYEVIIPSFLHDKSLTSPSNQQRKYKIKQYIFPFPQINKRSTDDSFKKICF
jgi:hypothetical protein